MYICIEGNIGSGKTTLAIALANKLNAYFLAEEFEKNTLLPEFYKNKKEFAYRLEECFLEQRKDQLRNHFKKKSVKVTVADYNIHKCLWFASANLEKQHLGLFTEKFNKIQKLTRRPDLLVHLNTSVHHLLKNIKTRGRNYENAITKSYLIKVGKNYKKGLKELKKLPILEIKIRQYKKGDDVIMADLIHKLINEGISFNFKTIHIR